MKWRLCAVLALALACDKESIYENTRPLTPGGGALPSFDGGFALDAGLGTTDAGVADNSGPFSKAGLLRALGDCALQRYRTFAVLAEQLRMAVRAYGETLAADRRDDARRALLIALTAWQELEMFRFGPAGGSGEPGGRDLRNQIYFYPDLNDCLVDQQLVARAYDTPATLIVNSKGLGALEYLLFNDGPSNSCSPSVTINANGTWAALGAPELARRRADYAIAVADDLVAQAKSLVSAWAPGEGDYHTAFTQAGTDTRLYARDQDAFNVVDNALYYFDKELKDFKVGVPLGRNPECGAPSCPERVESRLSGASNANIAANIVGFRLIVQGCGAGFGGLGFDDWLRASQQPELADALTAAAANAEQVARTLPAPLETLVRTDPARAGLLYDALKAVSDLLKAELPSALNLEPPAAVAGDND